ncbi:hypothetical protein [Picosynechococcus sp. NKBG042902]|uniref:hypothetical protein n=1 Tax=Picosynechococcus sp. NKBG042902 TaxID=490193 RepID=UPI0004AB97BF|nr:hypothetical protein [Picosynechococcus sp. NKBG042902]
MAKKLYVVTAPPNFKIILLARSKKAAMKQAAQRYGVFPEKAEEFFIEERKLNFRGFDVSEKDNNSGIDL